MMLKRIWTIFTRDIKINFREAMPLFIIIAPVLLAVGINLISPSVNDTTVNLALVEGENTAQAEYFSDFAHVELLNDEQSVTARIEERDDVIGVLQSGSGYDLLAQGNEPDSVIEYAKLLNVLYESDIQLEDARAEIVDFGRTVPPIKKMLVNILLLMIPMLSGMLIALNIVEEKAGNTVSAINVTPTSRSAFILGKGLIGMVTALLLSVVSLLITGFAGVNIGQTVLVVLSVSLLSLLIGFVQGLNSNDIMEAAGSVKLMFLPMAASVVGYEVVEGSWQIFFYWSPFYWAYRANDVILSQNGTWPQLVLFVGIIVVICAVMYALLGSRVREGLQKSQ